MFPMMLSGKQPYTDFRMTTNPQIMLYSLPGSTQYQGWFYCFVISNGFHCRL